MHLFSTKDPFPMRRASVQGCVPFAEGTMTFAPTNVQQASLYQTIQVTLSSNPLQSDVAITTGDRVQFVVDSGPATTCTYSRSVTATYNVTSTSSQGYTGTVTAAITSSNFAAGSRYVMCYMSAQYQTGTVMRRASSVQGADNLLVWPAVYSSYVMTPAQLSGGEGPALLALTETAQANRTANQGIGGSYTIFMAPCSTANCSDWNSLTTACAAIGPAMSTTGGLISLTSLQGTGTASVSGNFTVPYAPETDGYYVCVPYCYDSSCGSSSVSMSYTVVAATPANIVFSAANPGVYTRTPTNPQARELGYMYFTGTHLTTADQVKVVRSDASCTSSTASLLNNIEVGAVTDNGTAMSVSFLAPSLITSTITGRVCYKNGTTGLWSSAYLSASSPTADFTIAVMQPTSYTVSPTSPTVGMEIVVTFVGTGLNGSTDSAFLTASTGTSACGTTSGTNVFACTMAGGTSPTCTVLVNPSSNEEMELTVCYQRAAQLNYAQVSDTLLDLGARNPVFTISPYPVYAGQVANVTFTGSGLSSSDRVQIIAQGGTCGTSAALTTVSLLSSTEVTASTTYQYTIVGQAAVCGMICYYISSTALWVAVRPQTTVAAVSAACGADNLYIAPYTVQYSFAQLPSGAAPTVKETVQLTFSASTGSTTYSSPVSMKLVQAANSCTVAPCSGVAACQQAQASTDYVGAIRANKAVLMVGTAGANYIVCALAASGSTYIPVLPSRETSPTSTAYGFVSGASQVYMSAHQPSTWRVSLATPMATFTGSVLNTTTNVVYAVASTSLYYSNDTQNLKVCTLPSTTPTTMLTSTIATSSSTNTDVMFHFTGANNRASGDVVYFCYVWYGNTTKARITYAGTLTFSEAVPAAITWKNEPTDGYRATDAVTANITTKALTLSATLDSVFFYQFQSSSFQTGTCYCDATACASGTLVRYSVQTLTTSSTTAVVYNNPYGFNNYDYDAVYVVCYTSIAAAGTTYLDTLSVGMADPTYYSVSGTLRVGVPFTVSAVRRCVTSDCVVLSSSDSLIIILNNTQCADATGLNTSIVTTIGSATISTGGLQYTQRFVVDKVGGYRVCYRSSARGATQYSELVYSTSFARQAITVEAANPASFTTAPTNPSAWEFLVFYLTCSTSLCSACTTLRIVPGIRASCWEDVIGTYSSTNCLTTTSIQFPDQYVEAGNYTICYGDVSLTARRIPGYLTVLAGNPSSYLPTPTATNLVIYTNQASDYTIAITGTGLSTGDSIFLMPALGYTCHDLRTDDVIGNGTIQSWLTPSTDPNPLVMTANGATWVVSNSEKRFGAGMLYDTDLCPVAGGPCDMKLCYLRRGMSWAPVNMTDGSVIQVAASNPANITFDRYPLILNMYVMVTVMGSSLTETDLVYVQAGSCSGAAVTALIGTPYVNTAGTAYQAVLRWNSTADSYAVCYWRGASATEIATIYLPGQTTSLITVLNDPLYYAYSSANFSSYYYNITQYEEMIVWGTFSTDGSTAAELTYVELTTKAEECNYYTFYYATGLTAPFTTVMNFTVNPSSKSMFEGRLTPAAGAYVLCMYSSYGLFRVMAAPAAADTSIAIGSPSPYNYTSSPVRPFAGQTANITFQFPAGTNTTLMDGTVQLIQGTLYDCGFRNTTVIAEAVISTLHTDTSIALLEIPTSLSRSLIGVGLTLCFRKGGGTFATVPRSSTTDQNFYLMDLVPSQWEQSPGEAQVQEPLAITFFGNATIDSTFLTAGDSAFLVAVTDTTSKPNTTTCTSGTAAVSSASGEISLSGINTVWHIPSGRLTSAGTYAVCYEAVNNGEAVYVPSPTYLTVYARQSPTGAYTNKGGLTVFQGERFYLYFTTTDTLNLLLDNGSLTDEDASSYDLVRVMTDSTCTTPLSSSVVSVIPSSFGYASVSSRDPYLHMRVRASVGNYYICMKRANRAPWQTYYTYTVVGGTTNTAILRVTQAPMITFTTTPTTPRALVPYTEVSVTLNASYTTTNVLLLFFSQFTGTNLTDATEMDYDYCYRPQTAEEAASSSVMLVNTTYAVNLTTFNMSVPFSNAGTYLLCYQMNGEYIASVYPKALTVAVASPILYTVPSIIATSNIFTMNIISTAAIFSASYSNVARIYNATNWDNLEVTPSCVDVVTPVGGTTAFTSFTITNTTYASVRPQILAAGYYYLCFLTYDQTNYVPVPSSAGGYVFPVGLTGAQHYSVSPYPAYLGQEVLITITGNQLASTDYVKVVNATGVAASTYPSLCTASAVNVDASDTSAMGVAVGKTNGITAYYRPRMNTTGTFVLCYKSVALGGTWSYITDWTSFNVTAAEPTHYAVSPSAPYATEVVTLTIYSTVGGLSSGDTVMLVNRTSGFDCSSTAVQSSAISWATYNATLSDASTSVYSVCSLAAVSVTVCFQFSGTTAWAEVPFQSPPPNYLFEPIVFASNPFAGPTVVPTVPRPYEPFVFSFTSSVAGVAVTWVNFSAAPREVCPLDLTYVTTAYYLHDTSALSTFEVVLTAPGDYVLHLGTTTDVVLGQTITHEKLLTIGLCDPCSVTPDYAFVDRYVLLMFPSRPGHSLAVTDQLRLIPVSVGTKGLPCQSTEGPYGSDTFTAYAMMHDGNMTHFNLTTGVASNASLYLGNYYMCYKKSTGNMGLITDESGTPIVFSIYPTDLLSAVSCPASGSAYGFETATFNVTATDLSLYPYVQFSAQDEFVLVSSTFLTSCENIVSIADLQSRVTTPAQVVVPTLDHYATGVSNWYATLPSLAATTDYYVCFHLQYDSSFRSITSATYTVHVEDPTQFYTVPPVVLPDSPNVQVIIEGSELSSSDNVYVVNSNQSCDETCDRPITPTIWPGTSYTTSFVNSTTVEVTFSSTINTVTFLKVCYRRTGHYLTTLGTFYVGAPNPISYTVNFIPYVGTRPTLTFTGTSLTSADAFMIVLPGASCYARNAVATGTFVSVAASGTTSAFYLPLVGVAAINYTVCYKVNGTAGYVVVSPELPVLSNGPNAFATTNTPMLGRAFNLTFPVTATNTYVEQVGDGVFIACSGCSCFTGKTAVVPYGSVSGTVTASTAGNFSLRVGFGVSGSYPVCYRVVGSGFAQVGTITPTANSPFNVTVFPLPTYQGQRMNFSFYNFTTQVPGSATDAAMVVGASRLCWEPEWYETTAIYSRPTTSYSYNATSNMVMWIGHVPSLGPDTPDASLFPLAYLLCYREQGQAEYVAVPFPAVTDELEPADPANFTTMPNVVEAGMIDINVTFPTAVDGDEAYIVYFGTLTNTVCTDSTSTVLSSRGAAYPYYNMSLPPDTVVSSSNVAFCYIKANATVAEVARLLNVTAANPSGYTVNLVNASDARERQYINFTVSGTNLSATEDEVVFTETTCALASRPLTSSSYLYRVSEMAITSNSTQVSFVAQFIAPVHPITMHMCYRRNSDSMWHAVGAALTLQVPEPTSASLYPVTGSGRPRAGQYLYIELADGPSTPVAEAAVIDAGKGYGTWCHNFTADQIREPSLIISSAALLYVPVWQYAGTSRLCLRPNESVPWTDVAATVDGASLPPVEPANPSSMTVYPSPPRVGQSVTLTFHLIVTSSTGDRVQLTLSDNSVPCEQATAVEGFNGTMPVTVVDNVTTRVTLVDSTDSLLYRSFNATGNYRVCYYSNVENSWSLVGGTYTAGTAVVQQMVPQSWATTVEEVTMGNPFSIVFKDELGLLNATGDLAWASPSTQSCGVSPYDCAHCVLFTFDQTLSNTTVAVSLTNTSSISDDFIVCYQLYNATAAQIPGTLSVKLGPIECSETEVVAIGETQNVTFRIHSGVDVTDDAWRVSFYATSASSCAEHYAPAFEAARATQVSVTNTSVTYSLEWPVSLTDQRYTICYTHNGKIGSVCTCGQVDLKTGECYLSTTPGPVQNFTAYPSPTYVGQTITITLQMTAQLVLYPPTAVKFVARANSLTTCAAAGTITPIHGVLSRQSSAVYTYVFQHNYTEGSSQLMVCVLTSMSSVYMRVGNSTLGDILYVRPYFELTTFPSNSTYLRAMESINLTYTLPETNVTTSVTSTDKFTFVADPYSCTETYINAQDAALTMKMVEMNDSAFITLPASVDSYNNTLRRSGTLVTFSSASGVGTWYVCYLMAAGTWAPIATPLTVQPAFVDTCALAMTSVRAMEYAYVTIMGTTAAASVWTTGSNVRIVPETSLCITDSAVVFTAAVVVNSNNMTAMFFAPSSGAYKICYLSGGSTSVSNWSPLCESITATGPSPVGSYTGCLLEGQTISVTSNVVTSVATSFSVGDSFRFVSGSDACLYANGTTTYLSTVYINDVQQTRSGAKVTAAGTSFTIPYVLLGAGTSSLRLCYTDANGTQYAVPLAYASAPTQSSFVVQHRQPASLTYGQSHVQLGQRLMLNFTAASGVTPNLAPYSTVPSPYVPGPTFDATTYDGASLLALESSTVYRDGRCAAARRAGTLPTSSLLGVYGPTTHTSTLTNYDPSVVGYYVGCYQLAQCGVIDIGDPIYVYNYNPSSTSTDTTAPRRGQLIEVYFTRDFSGSYLTPGTDRGLKQANLASCWGLPLTAGVIVSGTTEKTQFTTIFYAQAPGTASNTTTRTCYLLSGSSWSEVPNGVGVVMPANPASFATTPSSARSYQMNLLTFTGTGLGSSDYVKIITQSLNCSADSTPPSTFTAYDASNNAQASSSSGWKVGTASSSTTTSLNFSSTVTGTFSVCYRLSTDTVWTLVYDNLVIFERNPQSVTISPTLLLEGELFTMNFTASASGTSSVSSSDRVILYYGNNVSCVSPGDVDKIVTSPSQTEFLPGTISYRADAGTRGNYTLCYMVSLGSGTYSAVWGFPTVVVEQNPYSMTVYPAGQSNNMYAQQLVHLLFYGWGLNEKDIVRLIPTTATYSNSTCRTYDTSSLSSSLHFYPIYANGTYSVQSWWASAAAAGSYWVCYKLKGGQYYLIGDAITVSSTATPSDATTGTTALTFANGLSVSWTLTSNKECTRGDILFYSSNTCNDLEYDELATGISRFPLGAAYVDCSAATAVRINATDTSKPLSLCYYHNSTSAASSSVSIVKNNTITVTAGSPPVLSEPIYVDAGEIFSFNLSVAFVSTDYLVFVESEAACQGTTAPRNDAYFVTTTYNATTGNTLVMSALPSATTYYICFTQRVLGVVLASPASPQSWTMSPSTLYASSVATIELFFPTTSGTQGQSSGAVWLAQVSSSTSASSMTMALVASACLSSTATVYDLTYSALTGLWTTPTVTISGRYALCYSPTTRTTTTAERSVRLFGPVSYAGPVVYGSAVSSVTFLATPSVATTTHVLLAGGGLSQDDYLFAVGVSNATAVPVDVCTNTSLKPHVNASSSTAGTGLSSIERSLAFTTTGSYVLCYLSSSASSGASPELLTSTPFAVMPNIISVTVEKGVQLVNTPLTLDFTGTGLLSTDEAAFVSVAGLSSSDQTVGRLCSASNTTFRQLTSVATDGTSATYTTTPTVKGLHMICYRTTETNSTILLSYQINVSVETATSAVFLEQPGGCLEELVCSSQPVIQLRDATGASTSSPSATVALTLYYANHTAAESGLLLGSSAYMQSVYTNFTFVAVRVATTGTFYLAATVTLQSGTTLTVNSDSFSVSNSSSTVVDVASLTCVPNGVIAGSQTLQCVVTSLTMNSPGAYTVQVSAGTATACVRSATTATGMYTCTFNVTTPTSTASGLTNYMTVTIVPGSPYAAWPVRSSPMVVWLATFPSTSSTIACTAPTDSSLPSSTLVRAGANVLCNVQGRATVSGVLSNIVILPSNMQVTRATNDDMSDRESVSTGSVPSSLNGLYAFNVTTPPGRNMSVYGEIRTSEGATTWTAMTNSPVHFSIISSPTVAATTTTCTSSASGSVRWFLPLDSMACRMAAGDASGSVNVVGSDFTVQMPQGGSANAPSSSTWGPTLTFAAVAPPQPSSSSATASSVLHRAARALASTYDWTFNVQVVDTHTGASMNSFVGTLVYVTAVSSGTYTHGTTATITLTGSGLDTTHRYILSNSVNCEGTATASASASAGSGGTGHVQLQFTVPKWTTFFVCFVPSDATTSSPRLLVSSGFETNGTKWTGADLALLIVGVVFLFILLILLALLLWRIVAGCAEDSRTTTRTTVNNNTTTTNTYGPMTVYMPPRANDRFTYTTVPPLAPAPLATPPTAALMASSVANTPQRATDSTSVRIRINDQDGGASAAPSPVALVAPSAPVSATATQQMPPPPPPPLAPPPAELLARATPTAVYSDPRSSSSSLHTMTSSADPIEYHQKKRKYKKPQPPSQYTDLDSMPPPPPPPPQVSPIPFVATPAPSTGTSGQPHLVETPRPVSSSSHNNQKLTPPPAPPGPLAAAPRQATLGPYENLHGMSPTQGVPTGVNVLSRPSLSASSASDSVMGGGGGARGRRRSSSKNTQSGVTEAAPQSQTVPLPPVPSQSPEAGSRSSLDNGTPVSRVVGHTSKPMVSSRTPSAR